MKAKLTTAMTTSISEVLETMFFMSLEIAEGETAGDFTGRADKPLVACRISFSGPFSGSIVSVIPKPLLTAMTMDFLSREEKEISATHLEGTLKELTNMVAGNTFARYDENLTFSLGIPEMVPAGDIADAIGGDVFIPVNTIDGPIAFAAAV